MPGIYDNEAFFAAYGEMPRSREGLSAAGEWSRFRGLFPGLEGKRVLDLGCGYGWHCAYAARMGADFVLGLDASKKMIEKARAEHSAPAIRYEVGDLASYSCPPETYDLVLSNLALHYVEDLTAVYRTVFRALRPGGCFLFNIEHPVFTAGVGQDWVYDGAGNALYWPVDGYYRPGPRQTRFLGQAVTKQHHTLTQILNPLPQLGFRLTAVEEAMPPEAVQAEQPDEMRRPMMLLVKAVKD